MKQFVFQQQRAVLPPSACCPLESLTLPVSLHAAFINEYQGVPLCSVTGSCQLLEADWETWRKRGPERDRLPGRKVFWQPESFLFYYFMESLCRVDVATNCCIGFLTLTSWTHWRYLLLFTSASVLTESLLRGFILRFSPICTATRAQLGRNYPEDDL